MAQPHTEREVAAQKALRAKGRRRGAGLMAAAQYAAVKPDTQLKPVGVAARVNQPLADAYPEPPAVLQGVVARAKLASAVCSAAGRVRRAAASEPPQRLLLRVRQLKGVVSERVPFA